MLKYVCKSLVFIIAVTTAHVYAQQASTTTVPGSIPAELSIDNGIASYSIPIQVAPGRAGMQPELSLHYSGAAGNGVLGLGWKLQGLSVIHRCSKTKAQDSEVGAVRFDENDRYCIDGQRLVPISGVNGAVGTEYRTEIDGYSRIISHGGVANNPAYWEVQTKAGQVMVFGDSNGATLSYPQGSSSWALATINDTTGNNPINFHYVIEQNNQYLEEITYVGGRVDVVYEGYSDVVSEEVDNTTVLYQPNERVSYFSGQKIELKKRIKAITTYSHASKLKEYIPKYKVADIYTSHLVIESVKVCGLQSQCYSKNVFDISKMLDGEWVSPHQSVGSGFLKHQDYEHLPRMFADVNGDGLKDLVEIHPHATQVSISNGAGFEPPSFWSAGDVYTQFYYPFWTPAEYIRTMADVNGDGLQDLVSFVNDGVYVELSRGTSFSSPDRWSQEFGSHTSNIEKPEVKNWRKAKHHRLLADMNGDGLVDIVGFYGDTTFTHSDISDIFNLENYPDGIYVALSTGAKFLPAKRWTKGIDIAVHNQASVPKTKITRQVADVDGDGLLDIISFLSNGVYVSLSTGADFKGFGFSPWVSSFGYDDGWNLPSGQKRTIMSDVNGDGLSDIVGFDENQIYVSLSTGMGFTDPVRWNKEIDEDELYDTDYDFRSGYDPLLRSFYWYRDNFATIVDFNGDGLQDIVSFLGDGVYVELSLGNPAAGFSPRKKISSFYADDPRPGPRRSYYWRQVDTDDRLIADFNGDGMVDIIGIDRYGVVYASESTNKPFGQLQSVTDSNGNTTTLSYKSLTDSSIYTKGSGAVFPVQDLQIPQQVISEVETVDGVGGKTQVQYLYEGLKVHLQGRGAYGYAKITEMYPSTGKVKKTTFDQRGFPYSGNIISVVEEYNGKKLNEAATTMAVTSSTPGVYQLYQQQSVQKSYELSGGNSPVATVTTTHGNVDNYGNIGRVTVATSGGGQAFTTITDSIFENDIAKWHLGRLKSVIVKHQSPYGPDISRATDFAYYPSTGLLSQERILSVQTGAPLNTKKYTYDSFGQKIETRLSATSEGERISTTAYNAFGQPKQTCNALNQCTTYTYKPEGWLESATDFNGLTTTWSYNGFGQKTREDRADGTFTQSARIFAEDCGDNPKFTLPTLPLAHSCFYTESSDGKFVLTQYDSLDREIRTIKQGFAENRFVYSDTQYNHLGQVSRVSRDYYMGDHIYWATSEYDVLDRVVRMTEPGPHGSTKQVLTEYNGLITTTQSGPKQLAKTTTTDVIGQVIRVEEEEGLYTEYTYDSIGNLRTTRVAGDIATTVTLAYDEFGRKDFMSDPDMGQWSYSYDGFNQLTSQTDAKNQTTTMTYDVLGRMRSRIEPEGTSTWTYADNTAAQGSIGKLIEESGGGVSKSYTYDSLGRPKTTTTTIAGEGSFTSTTSYDSLGRVERVTYPGSQGFYTENHYNDNGFLQEVRGLRSQAQAHQYGALALLVDQATRLADQYLAKSNKLRALSQKYQSYINNYTTLLAERTIDFETGSTDGLVINQAYDYLSSPSESTAQTQVFYIRVPDKFIPITSGGVFVPLIMPPEYHYKVVVNTQGDAVTRAIMQITHADFEAIESSLSDNGDQIYVLGDNKVLHYDEYGQYYSDLKEHQALLNKDVRSGQALSPEFLGHLNNTIVELQNVTKLINTNVQNYESVASQLVVLAEQTLAAADHSFQISRTLNETAESYEHLLADAFYNRPTISYWRAIDVDASGRISAEVYGNGVVNDYAYNQATGQLQSIHSGLVLDTIRHLEYQYDAYQNVTLRDDLVNDINESYQYDRLDRLTDTYTSSNLYTGSQFNNTQSLTYDSLGNITYKSDVGQYTYSNNNAGPHAVTQAGSNNYGYDANGNMISGNGRTIQWSSFNKPTQITQNGRSATFSYGPDRARFKKVNHQGDTTLYIGSLYERLTKNNGDVDQKHYIYAAGQLIAEHIVSSAEGVQTRYLHKDALGSIDLVTDEQGNVVDRRSFDSWGKMRDLPWQATASLNDPLYITQLPFTNKAYTGHENVQEVDLIHMNGRMYDATLARFISADPHIQSSGSSQNYNRYSYVMNNPMKYTDPSGYFFSKLVSGIARGVKKFVKAIRPYAGIIVAAVIFVYCPACSVNIYAATAAGAVVGAVGAAATGGNVLKGAFVGALTAGASHYIGGLGLDPIVSSIAHGAVGGAVNVIRGGKFGEGFASSAFTKLVSPSVQNFSESLAGNNGAASVFFGATGAALVGGTSAEIGGGKFANGAAYAAFSYAVSAGIRAGVNRSAGQTRFKTQHAAAKHALRRANPLSISEDVEYGGSIYQNEDGTYSYTGPVRGQLDQIDPLAAAPPPDGFNATATYHTHGAYVEGRGYNNENFSDLTYLPDGSLDEYGFAGDIPYADMHAIDSYLGTPSNQFKYYQFNYETQNKPVNLGNLYD